MIRATPALALETSGRIGSVALVLDGVVLAEEQFPHGLAHAARIIPVIDELCRARNLKPSDIAEIYVSIGPGSFTGLRVGITVAKTMAMATGAKLIAVPTVRVLAENAPPEAVHVAIVLDAKRGQIFTARFERSNSITPSSGTPGEGRGGGSLQVEQKTPTLTLPRSTGGGDWMDWIEREPAHLDTLANVIARSPRPLYLLGEGLPYHLPPTDTEIIQTDPLTWRARAAAVAALGWRMARAGQFTEALKMLPLYVRVPEAEEKFEAASKTI
jgi:tRNA threonylcarbamoyl adenosine modification protein YeaZ